MKKLMIMMAAVMIVLVAAVPAFAQTFEQYADSGAVYQVYESSTYGNGNAVATDADFNANTGNYQSQESFEFSGNVQYNN